MHCSRLCVQQAEHGHVDSAGARECAQPYEQPCDKRCWNRRFFNCLVDVGGSELGNRKRVGSGKRILKVDQPYQDCQQRTDLRYKVRGEESEYFEYAQTYEQVCDENPENERRTHEQDAFALVLERKQERDEEKQYCKAARVQAVDYA